jgi:thymidylate synthase
MRQYLDLLAEIRHNGELRKNRTDFDTYSLFGYQTRFDLREGFPAITTKQLAWKGVVSELLWFLEGSNDERRLAEIRYGKPREEIQDKTTIWTANAQADYWKSKAKFDGDLGSVYGVQWRNWTSNGVTVDQIKNLVDGIKRDPFSRRHIVSAWNVTELDNMALPPCHVMFQFYVSSYGELSCQLYQRSADVFLGTPFNIASYALLIHMVAQITGLQAKELIYTIGDAHIYVNHMPQVEEQMQRSPYSLPTLWLNPAIKDIDKFTMDDIRLDDYKHWPTLKGEMAV